MALQLGKSISRGDVEKMQKRLVALSSRAKNAVEKANSIVGVAVTTLETSAAAFGLGYFQARFGRDDVMGVPLGAVIGLGLHGFAIASDSEMSDHMHAFGNGAIAGYLALEGSRLGVRAGLAAHGGGPERPEKDEEGGPEAGNKGNDSLSDEDYNRMAP